MNKNKEDHHYESILAIDPTVKGFGYIVMEGLRNPVDWGVGQVRLCKNQRILWRIQRLIEMYQPEAVIIDDSNQSFRYPRVRKLLKAIEMLAQKHNVTVFKYSRQQVLDVFKNFGKHNKFEISQFVAEWLPQLAPRLPEKRKSYEAESEQYGLFDAAALGMTHFYLTE